MQVVGASPMPDGRDPPCWLYRGQGAWASRLPPNLEFRLVGAVEGEAPVVPWLDAWGCSRLPSPIPIDNRMVFPTTSLRS